MKKIFIINNQEIEIDIIRQSDQEVSFIFQDKSYSYKKSEIAQVAKQDWLQLEDETGKRSRFLKQHSNFLEVLINDNHFAVKTSQESLSSPTGSAQITAPLPGKIISILKEIGDKVSIGEEIIHMEAMKMEHRLCAEIDGVLTSLNYKCGQQVNNGDLLAEIKNEDS